MNRPTLVEQKWLPVTPGVEIDRILGGRYRILRVIGEGGMSKVLLGYEHLPTKEPGPLLALRLLHPEWLVKADNFTREHYRIRFNAETELLQKMVAHPNLVGFQGSGTHTAPETPGTPRLEVPFQALEYIEGLSTEALLKKHAGIQPVAAVRVVTMAAAGLGHAHKHGVIHRDVSPGNIMVSITGDAKVIDFGVAISNKLRRHTAVDERGTPKLVYGKPAYYAPEQFMTRALDPRTDIYGLGLVLLELITGRQAIPPDTRIQDLLVARDRLAAQLWERYTAIPAEVLRVVERMIAVSPDDRFGSMENVITALERAMPESALTTTRNFIARFAQVGVCLDQAADHSREFIKVVLSEPMPVLDGTVSARIEPASEHTKVGEVAPLNLLPPPAAPADLPRIAADFLDDRRTQARPAPQYTVPMKLVGTPIVNRAEAALPELPQEPPAAMTLPPANQSYIRLGIIIGSMVILLLSAILILLVLRMP